MSMFRNVTAALAALAVASVATAASAQVVAIQNARVMTVGAGGVIENGDVIIRDGIIAAVGRDLPAPEGATVIDATGRVVTPGIFAAYSQLGISEIDLDNEASDTSPDGDFPLSASLDALDAYNPTSTLVPINRAGGVTRALTIGEPGSKLFGGRGAIVDLSGRIASVTKPNAAQVAFLGYRGAALSGDTRMGSWAMLRETLDEAIAYAANPRDYMMRNRDEGFSLNDLRALQPVVTGQQPLIVGVNSAQELRNLIKLKSDYRLNVIVLGGAEGWKVARELAAANIPVVIDSLLNLPQQFEDLGATLANAARLNEAGVRISFYNPQGGTTHNLRLLTQLAGSAVAYGLPYDAGIAALTINPATMYGLQGRLGSLDIGKAADVVIWDGDPLELTTRPVAVFIDGRAMSMENRQTKMRDRYKNLAPGDLPFAYRGGN